MIAAQQYYIEYGTDINAERLYGLLPNYIPDYCLQTDNALDTWNGLILQAYKKVSKLRRDNVILWLTHCMCTSFFANCSPPPHCRSHLWIDP